MLILGLLGMYFDAAVVFFTNSSLFFRLAVAILCTAMGGRQCLPLSVVQLKGKHSRKPQCRNGVVDTFGLVLATIQ